MNRADRARWRTATSLADVGALSVAWLFGGIEQTPAHGGPPDPETFPYLAALAALCRAGFVTTNSQPAGAGRHGEWAAEVQGLASAETLDRLSAATAGTGLAMTGARYGAWFGDGRGRWLRRCWRDDTAFYAGRCPAAATEIRSAWWVRISDPEPGRNDRLWPALADFAYSTGGTS